MAAAPAIAPAPVATTGASSDGKSEMDLVIHGIMADRGTSLAEKEKLVKRVIEAERGQKGQIKEEILNELLAMSLAGLQREAERTEEQPLVPKSTHGAQRPGEAAASANADSLSSSESSSEDEEDEEPALDIAGLLTMGEDGEGGKGSGESKAIKLMLAMEQQRRKTDAKRRKLAKRKRAAEKKRLKLKLTSAATETKPGAESTTLLELVRSHHERKPSQVVKRHCQQNCIAPCGRVNFDCLVTWICLPFRCLGQGVALGCTALVVVGTWGLFFLILAGIANYAGKLFGYHLFA